MIIDEALQIGVDAVQTGPWTASDVRTLLAHILRRNRSYLLAHGDDLLSSAEITTYTAALQRAARGEPLPYVIGSAPFRHITLQVTPAVLIPRPETEMLVDLVIRRARDRGPLHIVDVGTGSGCIAISLALALPQATITATDISAEALAIARHNAQQYNVTTIQFHHGSLLSPVSEPIDIVVANLPYVSDPEWTQLDPSVKLYEPDLALRGGWDGLDLIRELLIQTRGKLRSDGAILLEIGWRQSESAAVAAQQSYQEAAIDCIRDYAGHDRIIVIDRNLALAGATQNA
jgi:release factor glutamine methyltransferase